MALLKTGICFCLSFFLIAGSAAQAVRQQVPCSLLTGSGTTLYQDHGDSGIIIQQQGPATRLFIKKGKGCDQLASFPFLTHSAALQASRKKLYLLHSRSFWNARLSIVDAATGKILHTRKVSSRATAVDVSANDSIVALTAGPLIMTYQAENLRTLKVFWEAQKQKLIAFHPAHPTEMITSVAGNHIQVHDINTDKITAELRGHKQALQWIDYHPGGNTAGSLDKDGNLFLWSISDKRIMLAKKNIKPPIGFTPDGDLVAGEQGTALDTISDRSVAGIPHFSSTQQKRFEIYPQPTSGYMPETGLLLGGGATLLFYPRKERRYVPAYLASSIAPAVTYGFNGKQIRSAVVTDLYSNGGLHFSSNLLYNYRERSFYFGRGGNADATNRQEYFTNTFAFNGTLLHYLIPSFKAGINFNVRHNKPLDFKGAVVSDAGSEGGWLVGIGPALQWDNRDNLIYPGSGSLIDAAFTLYSRNTGSDYSYQELLLNYRKYIPVQQRRQRSVLAFQAVAHSTWDGDVPFYQLPYFTSDRLMRGVFRNLYVDKQIAFVQGEFRSLFVPSDERFGYVIFAGAGDGAPDFFNNYSADIKFVYGAGYRQQVVPKMPLHLRIDIAFSSSGNTGIFGGIGVAF